LGCDTKEEVIEAAMSGEIKRRGRERRLNRKWEKKG